MAEAPFLKLKISNRNLQSPTYVKILFKKKTKHTQICIIFEEKYCPSATTNDKFTNRTYFGLHPMRVKNQVTKCTDNVKRKKK